MVNTGTWMKSVNQNPQQCDLSQCREQASHELPYLTAIRTSMRRANEPLLPKQRTVDLGDSVSATNLSAVGAIRPANPDTKASGTSPHLEAASHSMDGSQQTELATLAGASISASCSCCERSRIRVSSHKARRSAACTAESSSRMS